MYMGGYSIALLLALSFLLTSCGGSDNSSSQTDCSDLENNAVEDLYVGRGETCSLKSGGKYEFLNLNVHGTLRLDSGPVEIYADQITVTGLIDASATRDCPERLGNSLSDGHSISLVAEKIELSGILSSTGSDLLCHYGVEQFGRTSSGGEVMLEADSISFTGVINAYGGDGFSYIFRTDIGGFSVSGGSGGLVSILTRTQELPILSGKIHAWGGRGGRQICDVDGCVAGNGGDGGFITLVPPGKFPDLTVKVDGGKSESCNLCGDPTPGDPGVIDGLI